MTAAAPSWDDLYNDAKAELVNRRPDLNVNEGDISDMLMAAIAAVGDRLVGYAADLTRATFVDGARGNDLTKLASDHWNLSRIPAIQSIGQVSFTRLSGTLVGDIAPGTVVATTVDPLGNSVQFTTNANIHWGSGVLGPQSVGVTAVTGGISGNVAAGSITRINGALFDTFTVTNSAAVIGGAEAESDDQLRNRIRAYSQTLRRGTLAALEYGALTVPAVKNASAVEDTTTGIVTVYVTDGGGSSNAQMVSDVVFALEDWRAAGSDVIVTGGGLYQLNPIQITLAVRTGVDTLAIANDVKNAITARIGKLRIGETCSRSIIQQAALNVDVDSIIGCTVVLPAADVVPTNSQLIRTDPTFITVS